MIFYELHKALQNPLSVQHLNLAQANLNLFPPQIRQLQNLKTLDLRKNQINTIPEWIGTLSQLETLYLQQNELSALPKMLSDLPDLQKLDLSSNHFRKLNGECLPPKLKELYLGDNKLVKLACNKDLPLLQRLDLTANQLNNWPPLHYFPSLKMLKIGRNRLKYWIQEEDFEHPLEYLDLHQNKLGSIPRLSNFKALQFLDLSFNKLENLPKKWDQTPYLQSLLLRNNKLQHFPFEGSNLYWLKTLDLSKNQLKKLPDHLFLLPRLHQLNLGHNQIKGLLSCPAESPVRKLNLEHNQLTQIKSLPQNIEHLVLRYNPLLLLKLPSEAQEIIYLDATNTLLKNWPKALFKASKIKTLKGVENSADNQTMIRLTQRIIGSPWSLTQRQTFFEAIKLKSPKFFESWSNLELLNALNIYSKRLRQVLIQALLSRKPIPISKAKSIAIFGKLHSGSTPLKALLRQQNLSIKEASEIVILGKSPYPKPIGSYQGKAFYTEAELLNFLKQSSNNPSAQLTENQETRLIQLLLHPGQVQVKMGLILLSEHTPSQKLQAALLIAWKIQANPALKKTLRKGIDTHSSPDKVLLNRPLSLQRRLTLPEKEMALDHWLDGMENINPQLYKDLLPFL